MNARWFIKGKISLKNNINRKFMGKNNFFPIFIFSINKSSIFAFGKIKTM